MCVLLHNMKRSKTSKTSKTSNTSKTSKTSNTSHAITTNPNSADLLKLLPPDMIKQISRHLESNQRIKPTKGEISVTLTGNGNTYLGGNLYPRLLYKLDNKTDNRTRILFRDLALSNLKKKLIRDMKDTLHLIASHFEPSEAAKRFNIILDYYISQFLEELYIRQGSNTPLIANTKPLTKPHITVEKIKNINTKNKKCRRVKYKSYKFNVQDGSHRHGRSTRSQTKNRGTVKNLLQTSKHVRSALQPMSLNKRTFKNVGKYMSAPYTQRYREVFDPRGGIGLRLPNLIINKEGMSGLTRLLQDVKKINNHYNKQNEYIKKLVRNNPNPNPSRSSSRSSSRNSSRSSSASV